MLFLHDRLTGETDMCSILGKSRVLVLLLVAVSLVVRGAEPPATLCEQAAALANQGESWQAIELLNKAIAADSRHALAYYLRGREQFRIHRIDESVADFDEYVRLEPSREPRQWERGISLYYAGQYERGAKQFETYQTFEGNDVENAVWRYLCVAKQHGAEKARATLLPIDNDRRVPMMQIYQMFRGSLKPDDVLSAAHADNPPAEALAARLFYAHLYLGLYFDAEGQQAQATKYILLAANEKHAKNPRLNGYMWNVARVHAGRFYDREVGQHVPQRDRTPGFLKKAGRR